MLNFDLAISCVLPAIAALATFKKIPPSYQPFIYTIWLAVVVEIIAKIYLRSALGLAIDYNLFFIANLILFLWFFRVNKIFSKTTCYWILGFAVLLHSFEIYQAGYFKMCMITSGFESVVILIGCINLLSRIILETHRSLLIDFEFIVLIATIINCSFDLLNISISWVMPLESILQNKVARIYYVVNAFSYLLIFYGILCLKWKKN